MPFELLKNWLQEEKSKGAPNPQQAVLCTATLDSIPHSRVVAIKEITEEGLLFFTQKGTRKVEEILKNPVVSLTFWLELNQREIIIEGTAELLSNLDNQRYWEAYPREAQLRFSAYAPTSTQPVASKETLEQLKASLENTYQNKNIPTKM